MIKKLIYIYINFVLQSQYIYIIIIYYYYFHISFMIKILRLRKKLLKNFYIDLFIILYLVNVFIYLTLKKKWKTSFESFKI